MFKYRYIPIVFLAGTLMIFSCKKNYEKEPLENITEEYIWDVQDSAGIYARNFLQNTYTFLPNGFNRIDNSLLCAASDDAVPSQNGNLISLLANGGLSSLNNPDDAWAKNYKGIRKVNELLGNIDRVPMRDKQLKEWWKAEARFLRAMFYFEMVKRYGGVPLIGDKVFTLEDNLQIPRNTYVECVNYIVAECDNIKGQVRVDPIDDGNLGRITRGAVLALKARMLLYAASPLNNPASDPALWKKAADAAKDIMALNTFSLETSFANVFITRKNKEVILAFQRGQTNDVETNNAPVGFTTPVSRGYTSPTQGLVDAYGMKSGLPISDPASGYVASDPYTIGTRDPRFYLTIFHNGTPWLKRTGGVQTYEGGLDKPGGSVVQTKTGYYMRKFMADMSNQTSYPTQAHNFIIFRYAEVLLNLAEAQNEIGETVEAYNQLKALRARALITPGTNNLYGLKANMNQTQMRDAIRLERRLEMAFEEQRFWDIRRWKIAESVYNQPLHGIKITNSPTGKLTYQQIEVGKTVFTPKMYRYPIPYSEIVKNENLKQNEGWN
ncbi:RagB/SusD family nutrient uptake outer membrane protein [Daejeonella sp.]|uniref:RagB/SusD family nutrient uptake outer membrane protein n=1 Tax=Daejeonella sp. TaxID=2805397 RepID=UPI0030BFC8E8